MGTIWESILQEYSTNLCSCALVMLKLVFVLTLALAVAEDEEPWKKMKWRKEICEQSKSTDEVSGENDKLKVWRTKKCPERINDECKWFLDKVGRAAHIGEVALFLKCEEINTTATTTTTTTATTMTATTTTATTTTATTTTTTTSTKKE